MHKSISNIHALIMLTMVAISIVLLFAMDHKTHHWQDLLKPNNVAAFLIYYIPTLVLTLGCYLIFNYKNLSNKLSLALIAGIPSGIALVIGLFSWLG